MTGRRVWDAAGLAVLAVAVVVGFAHGSGARASNPAPTPSWKPPADVCNGDFTGVNCDGGRLVLPSSPPTSPASSPSRTWTPPPGAWRPGHDVCAHWQDFGLYKPCVHGYITTG